MWTNCIASFLLLATVTTTLLVSQWRLVRPTGKCDRDRSRLERALSGNPCFVGGVASPRLGETCLKQSDEALARGDFAGAAEPLYDLVQRTKEGKRPTGYEGEAERRLHRMPQLQMEQIEALRKEGKPTEARYCCASFAELYPWAPEELREKVKEQEAECRIEEITTWGNERDYDRALEGIKELAAAAVPAGAKNEGLALVPPMAEQAVRERLQRGQIDGAFDLLEKVREIVKERPDLLDRLGALREWTWVQVFGESGGTQDPIKLPAPVYAGPPQPDAPTSVTVRVKNTTGYPLSIVASAGTDQQQRHGLKLDPGATGKLVLPPGQHWQKASCPTAPGIRPYFGSLNLQEAGTYDQTFVVVTERSGP